MYINKVGKFTVHHRNMEEFYRLIDEIFICEEYRFTSKNKQPFIVDCGMHIGIATLYFKKLYPQAKILGFEPNPETFAILQKNLTTNNITDVTAVNAALSNTTGKDTLKTSKDASDPWTWGDTVIDNFRGDDSIHRKVEVKTVKLSDYITEPVDFLKIDVEGSEQRILEDIEPKMHLINRINLEFHDTPTGRHLNNIETILKLLKNGGFIVEITDQDEKINFADFAKYTRKTNGAYCVKCTVKARKAIA